MKYRDEEAMVSLLRDIVRAGRAVDVVSDIAPQVGVGGWMEAKVAVMPAELLGRARVFLEGIGAIE